MAETLRYAGLGAPRRFTLAGIFALVVAVAGGALTRPVSAAPYVPSQPVGSLAGVFSVDANGAATYQLAIQVPPGTGGAQPQLALT